MSYYTQAFEFPDHFTYIWEISDKKKKTFAMTIKPRET